MTRFWRNPWFWAGILLLALGGLVWSGPSRRAGADARYAAGPDGLPELRVVLAARDIEYCGPATPCGPGRRTDTILYVRVVGNRAWVVAVPRDTYVELEDYRGRINAVFGFLGPEGLARAVEQVIGLRVDHYAILTLEVVEKAVDAVDGVDVILPAPMRYEDRAAGLVIDLPQGPYHLNGADAVKYMRFRGWEGSDLGRLDRIKEVLLKVARKAASPEYWPRLPGLLQQLWDGVLTDLTPSEVLPFVRYLQGFELRTATLPVQPQEDSPYLILTPEARARFLQVFMNHGEGRATTVPDARVLILDGTGANLGERYAQGLARLGLGTFEVRPVLPQAVSQVLVDQALEAGAFYAEAVHLPLVTRYRIHYPADVLIVLGQDLLP